MGYNLMDEKKHPPHRANTGCAPYAGIGFWLRGEQHSLFTYSYK